MAFLWTFAISAKFMVKIERGRACSIEQSTARYVPRGPTQVEGVDFFDTYLPIGSYAPLQSWLTIAKKGDLEIKHVDIQSTVSPGYFVTQ